jgi:uncharacterized protein
MKFWLPFVFTLSLLAGFAVEMMPFEKIQAKWSPLPLAQIKAAAEKGDATAQHYLGRIHMEGRIIPRDTNAAVMWYEKAVAQDFPNSQLNLGIWLYNGERGRGPDRKRGLQLLRKAAETGAPNAHHHLARALETEGNPAEAAENFQKAAAGGIVESMSRLGYLHEYGIIERDYQKAYSWYKKAADAGDVRAMAALAEMLIYNRVGFGARPDEAKQWREKAIAKGYMFPESAPTTSIEAQLSLMKDADAQLAEADRLDQGDLPDRRRAFAIYRKLADENPKAALKVAQAYEAGQLTSQDDAQALRFYARSYDLGNAAEIERAMLRLIDAGRGLGPAEENQRVFQKLLSHGYNRRPDLAYRIGRHYDEGKIIPADLTVAVRHYRDAATRGSVEARNRLGELWLEGVNGQPDPEEAAKWFRSAAEAGYAPAQKNLERLAPK